MNQLSHNYIDVLKGMDGRVIIRRRRAGGESDSAYHYKL